MKIAFYSPLKSPNHPVPSGDRLMARLLMQALEIAGHEVRVVSELRSFLSDPSEPAQNSLNQSAAVEVETIAAKWAAEDKPDLWLCYHPYYKAQDLLGPELCRRFNIPYTTAEASYSRRRDTMGWENVQQRLLETLNNASVNICFTKRDRDGLASAAPSARLAMLPPFIDPALFLAETPAPQNFQLVTVAMMRSGDKLSSFKALANALHRLPQDLPWTLSIIGDGPERETVETLFSDFPEHRIIWHGEKNPREIAVILSRSALYAWPGHGEAYGLAYLEAQAAGLPVIAERIAGVPEVVEHERTGILTPTGDEEAYAIAIEHLLRSKDERQNMARHAREFATVERSLAQAAIRLDQILTNHLGTAS
jgi:glycosyltransferase involved in cell wall biosynthesis